MKKLLPTLTLGGVVLGAATLMALRPAAAASAAPAAPAVELGEAGTFEVDPGHSSVVFSIVHQGVSPFFGRFNKISGAFVFGDSLDTSSVRIEIDAASVDTNSKDRDDHLRSPDFFNVKQFPKIVFESSSIASSGDNEFDVTGELEMHGVKKEVTIAMEMVGSGDKGARFGYLAGFAGEFTINRSDFGITTYPGALGEEIRVLLGVEGRRQ